MVMNFLLYNKCIKIIFRCHVGLNTHIFLSDYLHQKFIIFILKTYLHYEIYQFIIYSLQFVVELILY